MPANHHDPRRVPALGQLACISGSARRTEQWMPALGKKLVRFHLWNNTQANDAVERSGRFIRSFSSCRHLHSADKSSECVQGLASLSSVTMSRKSAGLIGTIVSPVADHHSRFVDTVFGCNQTLLAPLSLAPCDPRNRCRHTGRPAPRLTSTRHPGGFQSEHCRF